MLLALAGQSAAGGEDGDALRQALRVAQSCAAWELQKLVPLPAQPGGDAPEGGLLSPARQSCRQSR